MAALVGVDADRPRALVGRRTCWRTTECSPRWSPRARRSCRCVSARWLPTRGRCQHELLERASRPFRRGAAIAARAGCSTPSTCVTSRTRCCDRCSTSIRRSPGCARTTASRTVVRRSTVGCAWASSWSALSNGCGPADAAAVLDELGDDFDFRARQSTAPDEVLDAAFLVERRTGRRVRGAGSRSWRGATPDGFGSAWSARPPPTTSSRTCRRWGCSAVCSSALGAGARRRVAGGAAAARGRTAVERPGAACAGSSPRWRPPTRPAN